MKQLEQAKCRVDSLAPCDAFTIFLNHFTEIGFTHQPWFSFLFSVVNRFFRLNGLKPSFAPVRCSSTWPAGWPGWSRPDANGKVSDLKTEAETTSRNIDLDTQHHRLSMVFDRQTQKPAKEYRRKHEKPEETTKILEHHHRNTSTPQP